MLKTSKSHLTSEDVKEICPGSEYMYYENVFHAHVRHADDDFMQLCENGEQFLLIFLHNNATSWYSRFIWTLYFTIICLFCS